VVCESDHTFQAFSAGHGGGRNVRGVADFVNGKRCAKNFGNAMDSKLTTGGAYVTRETRTRFKGYYRASPARDVALVRSFVQFEGEGETAEGQQTLRRRSERIRHSAAVARLLIALTRGSARSAAIPPRQNAISIPSPIAA
jgi:hypothetical protein